jgi:hypothetical protein
MGYFSKNANPELKQRALNELGKYEKQANRQELGKRFLGDQRIQALINSNKKGIKNFISVIKDRKEPMSPKEYPKYFDIKLNPTNMEPTDDIGFIYSTAGETAGKMALTARIKDLFNQMNLSGSDEDKAWTVLLEHMKDLNVQKRNNSVNAELDDLFNKVSKNAGSFFGGNAKKNHNRKTKKTRNTRRTRRNKRRRSA